MTASTPFDAGTSPAATDPNDAHKALAWLNRLYLLLTKVNQAVVRTQDRDGLFHDVCRAATDSGLFALAWVGLVDEDTGAVVPAARSGRDDGYVDFVQARLNDERYGQGPTARAVREGRYTTCDDIANDPRMDVWRDEALRRGFHSSGAFPIREDGLVIGNLNVYGGNVGFFTDDIITLMLELVADISFALDFIAESQRRRQAEQGLRLLNEVLEQRVVERTHQLEAANRELEAFSYSVSHDLRAPLRRIDGFSEILLKLYAGQLDDKGTHYLTRVRHATQGMGELIDDMLQLSQVSRKDMYGEWVNLSAVAHEVIDVLRKEDPQRKIQVEIQDGLRIYGDAGLLQVLMQNLLNNAWKFTRNKDAAHIHFTAAPDGGQQVFCVHDNGAGFDMQYAPKLFVAFQRLHSAHEFEGTGIGLATVQRIIHRHNGRAWAEGVVDQGARFFFSLPKSPTDDIEENI